MSKALIAAIALAVVVGMASPCFALRLAGWNSARGEVIAVDEKTNELALINEVTGGQERFIVGRGVAGIAVGDIVAVSYVVAELPNARMAIVTKKGASAPAATRPQQPTTGMTAPQPRQRTTTPAAPTRTYRR